VSLKKSRAHGPIWMIPIIYLGATVIAGLTLPRLENAFLGSYAHSISVSSAQAALSSIASGMLALTGIVFSLSFVMVTFGAAAYSPRLVAWLSGDPVLFHSLGIFMATFGYAIATLSWIDRGGSGKVPLFSTILVTVLFILSMLAFARLIQWVSKLQITRVLREVGERGRQVVREIFPLLDAEGKETIASLSRAAEDVRDLTVSQTLNYSGEPKAVGAFDIDALVSLAKRVDAIIVLECAVGDTLADGSHLLHILDGGTRVPEAELRGAIQLVRERTFEQDPKYPIRILVDIAIKALSPAINDPTTAVQAIDQIEDLLRRLGRRELEAGYAGDETGALRVIFPTPTWEDYLTLAFDEIRQYGATSVQVVRRLRSALFGLAETVPVAERQKAVQDYIEHLNLSVETYITDAQDQRMAMQEDRQGLGLSRQRQVKPLG